MERNNPVKVLKRVFGSGRMQYLCIFFSIILGISVYDKIQNRIDLTSFKFLGFEFSAAEIFGDEIASIFATISTILLVFSLLTLIPTALVTIGLWLIRGGSTKGAEASKKACVGLNLLKIYGLWQTLLKGIVEALILVLGLLLVFAGAEFGIDKDIVIGIIIAFILLVSYFGLYTKYYLSFTFMLFRISYTLRTGINHLQKERYVIGMNWFLAISGIVISVSSGIIGIILAVLDALCLIFVNQLYAEAVREMDYGKDEEIKEYTRRLFNEPEMEETLIAFGYSKREVDGAYNMKPDIKTLISLFFGSTISPLADEIDITDGYTPSADTIIEEKQNCDTEQKHSAYIPEKSKCLSLFSYDINSADERYFLLGEESYEAIDNEQVTISRTQIYKDSISDQKLLRLQCFNNSPIAISRLKISVKLYDIKERFITNAEFDIELKEIANHGEHMCEQFGMVLPDNTASGSITVIYIEYSDGLYKHTSGHEYSFATNEIKEERKAKDLEQVTREKDKIEEEHQKKQEIYNETVGAYHELCKRIDSIPNYHKGLFNYSNIYRKAEKVLTLSIERLKSILPYKNCDSVIDECSQTLHMISFEANTRADQIKRKLIIQLIIVAIVAFLIFI